MDVVPGEPSAVPSPKPRRRRWRIFLIALGIFIAVLIGLRLALPGIVRSRVNHIINQSDVYAGQIQETQINLWRGAYTIQGVKISKTTGNVPVPFITARAIDLSIQWRAVFEGSLVGEVVLHEPVLNFVDAPDESSSQAGGQGPWLKIITDLFPVKINKVTVIDGAVTFHAYHKNPQVDLHAGKLNVWIDNLTNIRDEVTPLVTAVTAQGMVMDQAPFQFEMELDPFSYYPTFDLRFRLLGLDVTRLNTLTRAYGLFDYEYGWFDLVIEMQSNEGQLKGYVQPLFRNTSVVNVRGDLARGNIVKLFWEALIGSVVQVFKNQPRDQFGTRIPVEGTLQQPQPDILQTLGNVLRNAFIRAYLPKLPPDPDKLSPLIEDQPLMRFKTGSIVDPGAPGDDL